MGETVFNVVAALGAIGAFISAIIALITAMKAVRTVSIKTEKLYGKEAEDYYNALLERIPERHKGAFGPDEIKGRNKVTPQFEVERFFFDRETMPPEWKKYKRTVRYYYMEGEKKMVRGWRLE